MRLPKKTALEIKTGQYEHGSHRGQVMLYSLLFSERYLKQASGRHLLVYILKEEKTKFIKASENELRSLVQKRNELTKVLAHREEEDRMVIPSMLPKRMHGSECTRCLSRKLCSVYSVSMRERFAEGEHPEFEEYVEKEE